MTMTISASSEPSDMKQTKGIVSETFEEILVRSAKDTFAVALGNNTAEGLFRTFEILQPEIKSSGIKSVTAFSLALDESFGKFSRIIKNIIVEKMCIDLGLSFDDSVNNIDFVMAVTRIKDNTKDLDRTDIATA